MMNSNPPEIEVPLGHFVKMNVLLWNCRGALNADFKRRIFEMAINHHPSIMVITETRVGGDRAAKIIEDLPFDGSIVTETIGYAGGLWLLWKTDDVDVMLLSTTEQEIHATVKVRNSDPIWLISAIYARPRLSERRILWDNLKVVAQLHNLPWLMLGDFNEVLSSEDKFGGNQVNLNMALQFKDCLDVCNMLDLGFVGPKYTWTNRRPISDLILERIDRCFANPSWRVLYPKATVTHLIRTYSDHCPVLIELFGYTPSGQNKPFRFHTMWLLHPRFPNIVQEAWTAGKDLQESIMDFVGKAKHCNYNVFGNLFAKKKRVLARINGTQKALASRPSDFLLNLEKQLIEEYFIILLQEEKYWALKSRLNAAMFGDHNTNFFHVSTLVRRHKNKIRCLKDSLGNWITDEIEIKRHINCGFEKLYTSELCMSPMFSAVTSFSCCFLSAENCLSISSGITDEEIRAALWSLKPFKAPGPDGLHAGFFQRFWPEVGGSICAKVKKVFDTGVVPKFLNETLITLVPKCQNPVSLSNYRPISLCNSVYKIVSKIIVARIRPFLSNLISPMQTAFVPGRRGADNVIIAQELIYTLDRKKGATGYMAIKLDLEKAYDRLEWSFIHKVLHAFHFPSNLIKVIMGCVSTTTISVLVNGGVLDSFSPSRGIRQGDPLSPYLFILCMEYLSHLIELKCRDGSWTPLTASRGNVGISHLLFVDDIILFYKVDSKACNAIAEVLEKFCKESGQKISQDKSHVYFSPNVSEEMKEEVWEKLGFNETQNIGKYLGFPILHKGANRRQYNDIVERVMNKLSRWKAKFLSFASRSVLIKSVMAAMPNHVMRGAALPTHICDKLDKINRDFLWGSTSDRQKMHLVGWNKIVQPKEEGGLGIQAARAKNIALLSKLNWRMYHEQDAHWAKIMLKKYCTGPRARASNPDSLHSSPNWRAIKVGFLYL